MNKAELVAQVAKESDLSKDAAEKAVDATFKNIEKALKVGDTVRIVGFGNFQVAQSLDRPQSAHRCRGPYPCLARPEIPRRQSLERGLQQLASKAIDLY